MDHETEDKLERLADRIAKLERDLEYAERELRNHDSKINDLENDIYRLQK